MARILPFRRQGRQRSRSLLDWPWLVPVLAVAAVAGFYGPEAVSGALRPPAVTEPAAAAPAGMPARLSFARCRSQFDRTCVVDGDTIRIAGEIVRLMDIDAPETRDYRCASEKALGDRATRRLTALLNSGAVRLVARGHRDTDRYGRSLRIVEVDGRSAGDMLVAEGLARPWGGRKRPWCA